MKVKDVVEFYGTQAKTAKALGITRAALSYWRSIDKVPQMMQYKIQVLTNGKLKAEVEK